MPDNISHKNGEAEIMVVGEPAWHRLGKVYGQAWGCGGGDSGSAFGLASHQATTFRRENEHYRVATIMQLCEAMSWEKKKATVLGISGESYVRCEAGRRSVSLTQS